MRAIRDVDEAKTPRKPNAYKKVGWVDIAMGIYFGGLALVATCTIIGMVLVNAGIRAIGIHH